MRDTIRLIVKNVDRLAQNIIRHIVKRFGVDTQETEKRFYFEKRVTEQHIVKKDVVKEQDTVRGILKEFDEPAQDTAQLIVKK